MSLTPGFLLINFSMKQEKLSKSTFNEHYQSMYLETVWIYDKGMDLEILRHEKSSNE